MKEKKKTWIAIISVIALVLVVIGITYAYWLVTKTQTNENVISSACLDISISNEANDITLTNQFPLSDEEGLALTPYTFTVTNNCNTSVDYQVALESIGTEDDAISTTALKVALDDTVSILSNNKEIDTTVSGAYKSNRIARGTLAASSESGASVTYELRLWIDEEAPISEMNKTYTGKISVTIGQGIVNNPADEYEAGTLAYTILSNYGKAVTPLDDYSTVTAGMYEAKDNDGTSYFYRGNVTDNYFALGSVTTYYGSETEQYYELEEYCSSDYAEEECDEESGYCFPIYNSCTPVTKPIYWRIVRINGDDSIRLIFEGDKYDYVSPVDASNIFDYSRSDGTATIKSSVLDDINTWYNDNLTNYSQYLADSDFCVVNEVASLGRYFTIDTSTWETTYSDTSGEDREVTYNSRISQKNPILSCASENVYNVNSGKLQSPIMGITADEALMAGGTNGYLADVGGLTGSHTMNIANTNSGFPGTVSTYTTALYADYSNNLISPVININNITNFKGNGTIDSPYEIVLE